MSRDRWTGVLHLPGLTLWTPNVLLRAHHHRRTAYRQAVFEAVFEAVALAGPGWKPRRPLERFELLVVMARQRLMDVDAKYLAPKVLLDVLQPDRRRPGGGVDAGLAVVANDTDGEGGLPGALASYVVRQVHSKVNSVTVHLAEAVEAAPGRP